MYFTKVELMIYTWRNKAENNTLKIIHSYPLMVWDDE